MRFFFNRTVFSDSIALYATPDSVGQRIGANGNRTMLSHYGILWLKREKKREVPFRLYNFIQRNLAGVRKSSLTDQLVYSHIIIPRNIVEP